MAKVSGPLDDLMMLPSLSLSLVSEGIKHVFDFLIEDALDGALPSFNLISIIKMFVERLLSNIKIGAVQFFLFRF